MEGREEGREVGGRDRWREGGKEWTREGKEGDAFECLDEGGVCGMQGSSRFERLGAFAVTLGCTSFMRMALGDC